MSSNLALKRKNLETLSISNHSKIDPTEISALFNILNAKPDSLMKTFPRDVNISLDDIFNLKVMIDEKLKQYSLNGKVEHISVRYEGNTFKDFKDWVQFREEVRINSNPIENINIVWDVMINSSEYVLPQRHTIVVRLSSFMSKSQMMQMLMSGNIEDLDEIDKNIVPVMCKVDCVNTSIGDEIIQVVGKWNEGLEVFIHKEDKFKKLRKYRMIIANLIRYSFIFSSIFILSTFIVIYLRKLSITSISSLSISNLNFIIMSIPFIYVFVEISKIIGFSFGEKALKSFIEYGDYHPFKISRGDLNKQKIIDSNNSKNKKTIIKMMLTIIIDIVIAAISTLISNNISI